MSSLPESCRLNVELKARVHDLQLARAVARQLTTRPLEKLGQRDTYFHCPTGRFKLREMDSQPGQLIWYQRASEQQARSSHYMLVDVADPRRMRNLLTVMLGIPFAIIGVIWGHILLGYEITFLSIIGFVALSGIVVNDSLIFVQFFNSFYRNPCYKK